MLSNRSRRRLSTKNWRKYLRSSTKSEPDMETEHSKSQQSASLPNAGGAELHSAQTEMLTRVGMMTRTLHDSLRGLGFDKLLERAAHEIPDARDRLDYVAKMTEQAAQRVLNATDAAGPLQDEIDSGANVLANAWQDMLTAGNFSEEQCR